LVRLAATLTVLLFLSTQLGVCTRPTPSQWCGIGIVYCGFVVAGVATWRATVTRRSAQARDRQAEAGGAELGVSGGRRYCLASLMVVVTTIALILGTIQRSDYPCAQAPLVTVFCVGFAAVTLLATWSFARPRWGVMHVAAAALGCLAIGMALGLLDGRPAWLVPVTGTQGVVVAVSVALFRPRVGS
jgi:hypothetical protein